MTFQKQKFVYLFIIKKIPGMIPSILYYAPPPVEFLGPKTTPGFKIINWTHGTRSFQTRLIAFPIPNQTRETYIRSVPDLRVRVGYGENPMNVYSRRPLLTRTSSLL